MAPDRLVGKGDQHQHRRADDQREDAEIEEQGAGQRHLADQRQVDIARMRRQEWIAEQPRTRACDRGHQQAGANPPDRQDLEPILDPSGTRRHILQDEGGGHGDAGGKAAARQVVPAQEQIGGEHDDDRKQPLHDDGGDHQPVAGRVSHLAIRLGFVEGRLDALLFGRADVVGRWPEAPQQGKHGQRHDAEYGDLSEGIKATEVDQDDVDDIASAAFAVCLLEEVVGDRRWWRAAHHCIGYDGHAKPGGYRKRKIAKAAQARAPACRGQCICVLDALGQPAQAQQYENRCHDLDQQLGNRKVGRGQPDEGDAGDEPRPRQQDEGGEAVELRLIGRTDGAEHAQNPDPGEGRIGAEQAEATHSEA
eukprot:Opistho-1_new@99008